MDGSQVREVLRLDEQYRPLYVVLMELASSGIERR